MARTSFQSMNCSVAQFAEILGDQWSLLILRDAFQGVQTFTGFENKLGVAKNVLTERLAHLVAHEVLERRRTRPGVERFTYHLTAKGKALFPVATAIMQWGDKWVFGTEGEPLRVVDKQTGAPVQTVGVFARDGRMLELGDVEYTPGPRAGSQ